MGLLGINFVLLQEVKVLVPLVADDLEGLRFRETHFAAGETSHGDDHCSDSK